MSTSQTQVPLQPAKNLNSLLCQDKYTSLIKCLKEGDLLPDALHVATTEPKHEKNKTAFLLILQYQPTGITALENCDIALGSFTVFCKVQHTNDLTADPRAS